MQVPRVLGLSLSPICLVLTTCEVFPTTCDSEKGSKVQTPKHYPVQLKNNHIYNM